VAVNFTQRMLHTLQPWEKELLSITGPIIGHQPDDCALLNLLTFSFCSFLTCQQALQGEVNINVPRIRPV
jgi:hypothetical protein